MMDPKIAVGDYLSSENNTQSSGAIRAYEESSGRSISLKNDGRATFSIDGSYYAGDRLEVTQLTDDPDGHQAGSSGHY